jgi:hypothetical protein
MRGVESCIQKGSARPVRVQQQQQQQQQENDTTKKVNEAEK